MDDIVKLVRMSKTTVFKRLMDFSKTATGKLTTDEFKTVDLEEEADPPCYTAGRNRVKFAQELGDKYDFVSSDVLSQVVKTQEKLESLLQKRKSINKKIDESKHESKLFDYRKELPSDYSLYTYELDEKGCLKNPLFVIHQDTEQDSSNDLVEGKSVASSTLLMDSMKKKTDIVEGVKQEILDPLNSKKLKDEESLDIELELDDIDDDEIDKLLLTEEEIKIKTEVWIEENKEYLLKMKEKEEEQRRKEEEENKDGVKKKKRTCKRKLKTDRPVCDTADEAIKTMLAERKLSSKINYDVLRGLKSEDKKDDFSIVKTEAVDMKKEPVSNASNDLSIVYENGPTTTNKRTNKRIQQAFPMLGDSAPKKVKTEENVPASKTSVKPVTSPQSLAETQPIIESGPVTNIIEDDECVDDEDEEEIVTASSLFARQVDDFETYDYEEDGDAFY